MSRVAPPVQHLRGAAKRTGTALRTEPPSQRIVGRNSHAVRFIRSVEAGEDHRDPVRPHGAFDPTGVPTSVTPIEVDAR